jgi:hypothetical protein
MSSIMCFVSVVVELGTIALELFSDVMGVAFTWRMKEIAQNGMRNCVVKIMMEADSDSCVSESVDCSVSKTKHKK